MKIVIELPSKNEALITVITMALFSFADRCLHRTSFRTFLNGGTLSGLILCRATHP